MMHPGERRFIPQAQPGQNMTQTLFGRSQPPQAFQPTGMQKSVSLRILANDLLLIGVRIKDAQDLGTPQSLKKLLISYFDAFEINSLKAGQSREAVEQAKYALASFLDESVLNRGGDVHEFWVAEPLTVKFFNDPVAGENFFTRLETLVGDMGRNLEVVVIYYICLALGFQGRYRLTNSEKLPIIIENLLKRIEAVKGPAPKALSPAANVHPGSAAGGKGGRWWVVGALGLLVLSFIFYMALLFGGGRALDEAKNKVQKIDDMFYQR